MIGHSLSGISQPAMHLLLPGQYRLLYHFLFSCHYSSVTIKILPVSTFTIYQIMCDVIIFFCLLTCCSLTLCCSTSSVLLHSIIRWLNQALSATGLHFLLAKYQFLYYDSTALFFIYSFYCHILRLLLFHLANVSECISLLEKMFRKLFLLAKPFKMDYRISLRKGNSSYTIQDCASHWK